MSDRPINESTYLEVVEALTALIGEKVDYMLINCLGDPEAQHTVKQGRAALATLQGLSPAQATDDLAEAVQHDRAWVQGAKDARAMLVPALKTPPAEVTEWELTKLDRLIERRWAEAWEARAAIQAAVPRGEEPPTLADARRYQWLRENKHYALLIGEEGFGYSYAQVEHWSNAQNAAKLDAAVDAARRGTPPLAPSVVAGEAAEREAILRAAVAAMPNTNPGVADDLIEGHSIHMEPDDLIAVWRYRPAAAGAAIPRHLSIAEVRQAGVRANHQRTLMAMLNGCEARGPDARVLGNVRAEDAAEAIRAYLATPPAAAGAAIPDPAAANKWCGSGCSFPNCRCPR